jgi:RNA polymerase sigma factor (sigma-70 family)
VSNERRDEAGATTAGLFERLAAGDAKAPDDLFAHFYNRLRRLAKKVFTDYPRVAALHQTDDVFHGAAARLVRAIREVKPTTPGHFWGLAAECIRRELIDLSRKEYGPHGDGRRVFANRPADTDAGDALVAGLAAPGDGPLTELTQTEFHEKVGDLPELEREVFKLLFYCDHTQEEVSRLLGIAPKTVSRRWIRARLKLNELLGRPAVLDDDL